MKRPTDTAIRQWIDLVSGRFPKTRHQIQELVAYIQKLDVLEDLYADSFGPRFVLPSQLTPYQRGIRKRLDSEIAAQQSRIADITWRLRDAIGDEIVGEWPE